MNIAIIYDGSTGTTARAPEAMGKTLEETWSPMPDPIRPDPISNPGRPNPKY